MTLKDRIRHAVKTRNKQEIGKLVDLLRFRHGCTYANILDIATRCVDGLTAAEWDELIDDSSR